MKQLVSNISNKILLFLVRLVEEPPFRIFARTLIKILPAPIRMKAKWEAVSRPHYLAGVLAAADQAIRDGVPEISVIELGVAGGNGLLLLEKYAAEVEQETGVNIKVYGFDTGAGIPRLCGDYRDHPDQWRSGDYPMDETLLKARLSRRTTLVIGDIRETVPKFARSAPPIGFVAVDVDLYSSAVDALRLFSTSEKRMIRRVPMYFDDVDFFFNHKFAGELLAIQEFNTANNSVKIDRWRGIQKERPFPESPWLKKMYIAHDLDAISRFKSERSVANDLTLK